MQEEPNDEIFLGRQPILDLRQHLFAYELLFRNGHLDFAEIEDNVQATATVIVNTFNGLGVDAALGDRRGFINVDEAFLFSDTLELLPPQAVVLEILETVPASPEVIARCHALKAAGYTLALDDVTQVRADYQPLIELVDIIKVDVSPLDRDELASLAARLVPLGKQLLAEKVESQDDVDFCSQHGFTLFQGYFFARPSVIAGKRVDYARLSLVRLLGMAIGDAETAELENELKHEPALVVKLLRMINSAGSGNTRQITSLRHAITLLGRRQLQRWLQLLIFASGGSSGQGNPLLMMAAARGHMMELLAAHVAPEQPTFSDHAFMVGVISLMPAVFGVLIDEIIAPLHLPQPVQDALCGRKGRLGKLLDLCESSEGEELAGIGAIMDELGIRTDELNRAQTRAMAWAARIDDENGAV
ncbi:MAG: EAL domain-containing protein [Pseudazoarcus pumilus]|nr:EAL domain-containing protein [Pseudazoarcus pumilus]